jgi:SAM-dependent methyltransferase
MGQFWYFDSQLEYPDWRQKTVLDFGGNVGNMLRDRHAAIEEPCYWCIDVSRDAIQRGAKYFPRAHWVFYDRYNYQFNFDGDELLPIPNLKTKFDFILALSVFTHTSRADMIDLVGQLRHSLKADGCLAFTFLDPHYITRAADSCDPDENNRTNSNLAQRLRRRRDFSPLCPVRRLLEHARNASWCTLVNDSLYVDHEEFSRHERTSRNLYEVFYTPDIMMSIFPDGEILPPVNPSFNQHCVLLRG